jgi:hypothetical protein
MHLQYKRELDRIEKIRREHLPLFIEAEREEIVKLWDAMYISQEERTWHEFYSSKLPTFELH